MALLTEGTAISQNYGWA